MKVLLTGAFGNVGRSTLDALLAQEHQVRCLVRPTAQNRKFAASMPSGVEIAWGDVCNMPDVSAAIKDQEAIIHTAAIIAPVSEEMPERAYQVNVEGTRNLLDAAAPSTKFIYASSIIHYGAWHYTTFAATTKSN
jgi:nucleoside-diphosphate-sugar epimerase